MRPPGWASRIIGSTSPGRRWNATGKTCPRRLRDLRGDPPGPDLGEAYAYRGYIRLRQDDDDKALRDFDTAIEHDARCLEAYECRGWVLEKRKEYRLALADFDEIVRLKAPDPTYAMACDRRAWIRATCPDADLRDGKRAVESAAEACKRTNSSNAGYLLTLGAAHAEAGDFDRAVEAAEKAHNLVGPDDEQAAKWSKYLLDLFRRQEPYHLQDPVEN